MLSSLRPALALFAGLTLITGVAYPLCVTAIGQGAFPHQAAGSLVSAQGRIVGSSLIGQNFTQSRYAHPRPSATMGPDAQDPSKTVALPYNGAASVASNLGPTSHGLIDRVHATAAALAAENPEAIARGMKIPTDLVTTSGSGLDPEISPQAAYFQAPRIARARGIAEERVRDTIRRTTQTPLLGWLGEPRVNVLALNLELDKLH